MFKIQKSYQKNQIKDEKAKFKTSRTTTQICHLMQMFLKRCCAKHEYIRFSKNVQVHFRLIVVDR